MHIVSISDTFSVPENVLVIVGTEGERCVSFDNGFSVLVSIEVEIMNIDSKQPDHFHWCDAWVFITA